MRHKNIVLAGLMGSGKSMVSNRLAEILHRDVVSIDALIEQKEKRPIAVIFKESGEAYFRDREREVVREVSARRSVIIDCGGGVVLNPANITDLKRHGVLFFLSASAETIYRNIKEHKHRPLLNVPAPKAKIRELIKERKPLYEQADHTVETDHKTIDQVCAEIVDLLK
jgi:shikimate kinase